MGSVSKTKKKNIPKSIHEMSKETLQETLKKKKECNAKALLTVQKLCEENVDDEWFLDNLQFINQCHFDDVTIERAITKICGYPLCDRKLDKIPAQQYHISTRYNKVFDITERKNFCSSTCYKSAMYIKKQLFSSPLWFRDQEVIPKYKVLKATKSSLGEEIVFSPDKIKLEAVDMKKTNPVVKNTDIKECINEVKEKHQNLKLVDCEKIMVEKMVESTKLYNNEPEEDNFSIKINTLEKEKNENIQNCKINNTITKDKALESSEDFKLEKVDNIKAAVKIKEEPLDVVSKTEIEVNNIEDAVKIKEEPLDVVSKIEKYFFEWFSLDTLFYLYREEKLKEIFNDKADKIKEIINSRLSMAGYNEKIDKIIKLYGLLDMNSLTKNEIKTNLQPLPDYSVLKEEGKTLEIKVRAFYQGQLEVKPDEKLEKKEEEKETKTDSDPIYLPLIDAHAQKALRRKIVLDKLNRVLPELIRVFSSNYILQMNEVRNLVSTFTLEAHNIVFKPREWYLLGIIIIKLLCLKNKQLELLMNSKSAKSQILLILSNYQLESDYLDNLVYRLTESTNVILRLTEINK